MPVPLVSYLSISTCDCNFVKEECGCNFYHKNSTKTCFLEKGLCDPFYRLRSLALRL